MVMNPFNNELQSLHRPVPSDDNEVLAVLQPDKHLHIVNIHSDSVIPRLSLPKSLASSIGEISILKWSPESITHQEHNIQQTRRWILLVMNARVAVVAFDVDQSGFSRGEATLLVDYQLETHLGKITLADFVISHEHILVIFETGVHASMLSTTSPRRSDIPLPKYPGVNGLAQSILRNSIALLTKSKGQDNIAIFTSIDGVVGQPLVFAAGTSDAQGLAWSPNGDPILAVWDTAAQGIQVLFFTALGHPLKKLKLVQAVTSPDQSIPGIGISHFVWIKSIEHDTILAIGDGHGNVFVRGQNNKEMKSTALAQFSHTNVVDGSTYIVWQEHDDHTFMQQEIAMDLQFDTNTDIQDISFNSDRNLLCSKIASFTKAVWIWQMGKPIPITVLIFQHEVKQICWHPRNPRVLVITTNCKKPIYYCWHDIQLPPQRMETNLSNVPATSKWKVEWLASSENKQRVPLMISSTRTFELGLLERREDNVYFVRTSERFHADEDESITVIETPSKVVKRNNNGKPMSVVEILAAERSAARSPQVSPDQW